MPTILTTVPPQVGQLTPVERLAGVAVRAGSTYLTNAYGEWVRAPPPPPRESMSGTGTKRVYLRGSVKKRARSTTRYNRFQQVKAPRTLLRELKNHDVADTTKSFGQSSITLCNGIAQGDDESTRDGRRIAPDRMEVIVKCDFINSVADVPYRILCVVDTMPNGATPAITDILTAATTVGLYNLDNAPRFKVCYDEHGVSRQGGNNLTRFLYKSFVCNPGMYGYAAYADSGATVTSIIRNAMYVIWLSDTAPTASQGTLTTRYRFTDQ